MKKFILIGLIIFNSAIVMASQTSVENGSSVQGGGLHSHEYTDNVGGAGEDERTPYGIGADIVVLKTDTSLFEEVAVEPRYDLNNNEWSVYAVARVDLWDALQGR